MQEVAEERNTVLHRNIKGGQQSDLQAEEEEEEEEDNFQPDSVVDEEVLDNRDAVREKNQRTQIELPPEPNEILNVEEEGGEREVRRGVMSEEVRRRSDDSLEKERRPRVIEKHLKSLHGDEKLVLDGEEKLAEEGVKGGENESPFRGNDEGVGGVGGVRQEADSNRPVSLEEVGGEAHEREEEEEVGLKEGNQLPVVAGRERVVVKKKPKPKGSPATTTDVSPSAVVDSNTVKPKYRERVLKKEEGVSPVSETGGTTAPPSLPPGKVSVKSKAKVAAGKDGAVSKETGGKSDSGAPSEGVKGVLKESVGGGGGGGGGGEEEKKISAVEMARAIESGEMVSPEAKL